MKLKTKSGLKFELNEKVTYLTTHLHSQKEEAISAIWNKYRTLTVDLDNLKYDEGYYDDEGVFDVDNSGMPIYDMLCEKDSPVHSAILTEILKAFNKIKDVNEYIDVLIIDSIADMLHITVQKQLVGAIYSHLPDYKSDLKIVFYTNSPSIINGHWADVIELNKLNNE